jgi:hypothetical protein
MLVATYVVWPSFLSDENVFKNGDRKKTVGKLSHKVTCNIIWLAYLFSLLCGFTFWVPCYDGRNDFRLNTMFGSFLPPIVCIIYVICVCRRAHALFMLFVSVGGLMSYLCYLCLLAHSGVQHILCCVFVLFVLCFVYPLLCFCFVCLVFCVASFSRLSFWLLLQYSLTFF